MNEQWKPQIFKEVGKFFVPTSLFFCFYLFMFCLYMDEPRIEELGRESVGKRSYAN